MQVSLYDCGGKGGRQALQAAALAAVILVQEADRHRWVSYAAAECARGEAEQQGEGERHGEL